MPRALSGIHWFPIGLMTLAMTRAVILMMDSFGLGATADADRFGDVGANTFGSIARVRAKTRPLQLPNLAGLGLVRAATASANEAPEGCADAEEIIGAWGYAEELSSGKDTPSGHWEMAGVPVSLRLGLLSLTGSKRFRRSCLPI